MKGQSNNEILEYRAVYNHKVYHSTELKTTTLEKIFQAIRTDGGLKNLTDELRKLPTEKEQQEYKKKNFPYFNLSSFRSNHRVAQGLISTSFFIYDLDHLDGKLKETAAKLKADPHVFGYFVSPRGNGLKVIYRLENEITDHRMFSQLYKHYASEMKIDLGVSPDTTSDAARACFFSYDPQLYYNLDAIPLNTDIVPTLPALVTTKEIITIDDPFDSSLLRRAVEHLRRQNLSYNDWLACGLSLAPLGEYGRHYFRLLSDNSNFSDTPAEIDRKFDNLLGDTAKHNPLTTLMLIAANYGFEVISFGKDKPAGNVLSFAEELEQQFLLDDTRDPNKLLGFPLTRFQELAGHVDGLQPGFYLLGAESNVGKTAVLTNMCLDVLETNPDVTVMYFSLDDARKYTAYRFLGILTGMNINDTRKQQTDPAKMNVLDNGREMLLNYLRSGRFVVQDTSEIQDMDQLKEMVSAFPDKTKLVVFIDGLYNLQIGDNFSGNIREENIERARQVKFLVDTHRIPIITTGELRKKTKEESKDKAPTVHDLMETGKFAYNANVVWLLYGKKDDMSSGTPTLTLEYVKNKLADYKGIQELEFTRATGEVKELRFQLAVPQNNSPLFNNGGGLE